MHVQCVSVMGKPVFSAADRAELARVIRELYGIRETDDRSQDQEDSPTGAEIAPCNRVSRAKGISEVGEDATPHQALSGEAE